MIPKKIIIAFLLLLISFPVFPQVYTDKDAEICSRTFYFGMNRKLSTRPMGEVMAIVGRSLLKTPYLAHGIEGEGDEQLVINITGVDCTTFLENVLTFSRLIKKGDTTFADFAKELTLIRYRDGKIDKYPSRLHYFSDWIYDNIQKNIVEDITGELGGVPIDFDLNFMSEHPRYYKQLEDHPEYIAVIRRQEDSIRGREYYYIPKLSLRHAADKIKEGDIIAFTTSVKGLDIGHVGIAVKQDLKIHLLHAPEVGQSVQITQKPLQEYIRSVKKHTGVIVLRPLDPLDSTMVMPEKEG